MIPCKKLIIGLFTLALTLTNITSSIAAPVPLDKVAVQINDGVILQSEIDNMLNTVKENAKKSDQTLPSDSALKTQIIDRLILTRLQLQMANRMGLHVGDLQLDQTIDNIAKERHMTVDQLRKTIEKDGESFSQYREQLREDITIGEVQRIQVQRRIQISSQETNALVNIIKEQGLKNVEFKIGHILIELPNNPTNKQLNHAKEQAKSLLQQLKNGANFEQVAIASSAGPKALEGGIWDYMNINAMPTLFAEAVNNAKKGDIIGPIKSGSGLHIIKIMDIKGMKTKEVDEVKSRHILLKPSPILSDERAKNTLAKFLHEIKQGKASFAELAKKYSEDPGSATKGGELGWADPNMYVPAFAKTLDKLKPGQISQPFRSSHGWHIVQLEQRRKIDATDKFTINRAHQLIFRRKFAEELQSWLDEMRSEAYIHVFDEK